MSTPSDERSKPDQPVDAAMVVAPDLSSVKVYKLEPIQAPYRPLAPFILPGQPVLIDPMVTIPQICLLYGSTVVAQCNAPADPNEIPKWQEVVNFLRVAVTKTGLAQEKNLVQWPQIGLVYKGQLLEHRNAPADPNELNVWQEITNFLRTARAHLAQLESV